MVEADSAHLRGETGQQACSHHWQIETPAGETSLGVCKLCGATRSFANYSAGRTMTRSSKPTPQSGQRLNL